MRAYSDRSGIMKHGFIKVAAATPYVSVADCRANLSEMRKIYDKSLSSGVKLLVYPELCITGYTCADLFYSDTLLSAAKDALLKFARYTSSSDMISIIGLPLVVNDKIYNCAAICQKGQILGVVPKTNIPNYGEFCEDRYFAEASEDNSFISLCNEKIPFGKKLIFTCKEISELKIAVEICEDLFAANSPSTYHTAAGAIVIANPAASDELVSKGEYLKKLVEVQSAKTLCGYIFSSCGEGESTTDLVFAGRALIAEMGEIVFERGAFEKISDGFISTEIDVSKLAFERRRMNSKKTVLDGYTQIEFSLDICETELTRAFDAHPFVPEDKEELAIRCEQILSVQAHALKQRIEKSYSAKCVLGISGGLDSCLAILVAARAMDLLGKPRNSIIGVTMPCFGTTGRTRSNAEKICEELGAELRCVDIGAAVKQHFADIGHDESIKNVVFENAQARERTQVIMDIANAEGGLVVGTGDLSELALGWATYNGDHMSMYGVNAGIPKTLIRHIVRIYAENMQKDGQKALAEVLFDILDTPVSPELLPADEKGEIAQKTEDIVGPYEIHDFYIYNTVRFGFSPDKLYRMAKLAFAGVYSDEVLLKWLKNFARRFFAQQFKRSCLPDGPKIGSVGFSPRGDFRMPSDASSAEWLRIIDDL